MDVDTCKRKRSTLKDFKEKCRKRCRISVEVIETVTNIYLNIYLNYDPFSWNFNNITRWLNLTNMNVSNNGIDELPTKLGTLPHLRRINLSQNCLSQFGWQWLKQTAIRNTLLSLDISKNSLTDLSENIWKLNALVELKVSHNKLGRLLPGIEDMRRSLRILDLSHNSLMYLPVGICKLRLHTIDLSMNPLVVNRPKWESDILVPSLVQFAAKKLQQYWRTTDTNYLSNSLSNYLSNRLVEYTNRNTIDTCFYCGNDCTNPYVYATRPLVPIMDIAKNVIRQTSEMPMVLYEFCYCFPECKDW